MGINTLGIAVNNDPFTLPDFCGEFSELKKLSIENSSMKLIARVIRNLAQLLLEAHNAGLVLGRELKPEHIRVTDNQRLRIAGLGVSIPRTNDSTKFHAGEFAAQDCLELMKLAHLLDPNAKVLNLQQVRHPNNSPQFLPEVIRQCNAFICRDSREQVAA